MLLPPSLKKPKTKNQVNKRFLFNTFGKRLKKKVAVVVKEERENLCFRRILDEGEETFTRFETRQLRVILRWLLHVRCVLPFFSFGFTVAVIFKKII